MNLASRGSALVLWHHRWVCLGVGWFAFCSLCWEKLDIAVWSQLICYVLCVDCSKYQWISRESVCLSWFVEGAMYSVQFISVTQSRPTLCDPMGCSTPGLLVHHQLPEFTQTHVRWVGDSIQPSHPLLSPSPPAFNLSQQLGLFKWVSPLHQVVKVLEFQLQHWFVGDKEWGLPLGWSKGRPFPWSGGCCFQQD